MNYNNWFHITCNPEWILNKVYVYISIAATDGSLQVSPSIYPLSPLPRDPPKNLEPFTEFIFISSQASDVEIEFCRTDQLKPKPAVKDLVFGVTFTDHMLEVEWTEADGWGKPKISPFHYFSIHPGAKVLHYATELFEGMKAYRTCNGQICMFRPDMNMKRMIRTAKRASLPTFDQDELIVLMKKLISIDQEWVPHAESSSLYIRPAIIAHEEVLKVEQPRKALLFVILSPTGPYFTSGYNPVSLLADPKYVRAWPGGCGQRLEPFTRQPSLCRSEA
ncbi:hypothetical protein HAZT_HAZT003401 [Hyalella azteca]|uniref:branched-chain-amino-acid transaminase n=1 Tax=Hyalella azteca TaxID=294128 RepID=A0A6A0H441_HYAAZ|nr:hypothetical protein HAZT_HAZT003401 [Hyalella azteca]